MADRSAKTPDEPGNAQDIVELVKDDRWQTRLEEARARREIALAEKAAAPAKKRLKPWEDDDGDGAETDVSASEKSAIDPVIQARPEDESGLDFADRLDVMREAADGSEDAADQALQAAETNSAPDPEPEIEPKPEPTPEPNPEPKIETRPTLATTSDRVAPIVAAVPSLAPSPLPKKPKAHTPSTPHVHDFDQMGTPGGLTTQPAPGRARRDAALVANDAPDVIDLAQRYAATLKPPNNVTVPFDSSRRGQLAPPQADPMPEPVALPRTRYASSRRPFGLSIIVLAFSLVPLSQMAPPLEKGPSVPDTPFFGLPPALGLPTSWVWLSETQATAWNRPAPGPTLGTPPITETFSVPRITAIPGLGTFDLGDIDLNAAVAWTPLSPFVAPVDIAPLAAPSAQDRTILRIPRLAPRPRPTAPVQRPEAAPDADTSVQSRTVVDLAIEDRSPVALAEIRPDARPVNNQVTPEPLALNLNLTILVPNQSARDTAEDIAAKAQARGTPRSIIRSVDVNINTPNVRYFHNDDRAEATRLAREYGVEVRDFTWFRPQPDKGTAEFWLSGDSDARRPSPPANPPAQTGDILTPEVPPQTITLVRKRPTLLERMLTGAQDEIEIVLPDPNGIFSGNISGNADGNSSGN